MELKEWFEKVANTKYTMTGSKIAQRERNLLKREFVGVLCEHLASVVGNDLITVVETQKGIGIAIDNENIGYIPIEIVPTFKDTECDIVDLAEEYQEHKADMQEKAEKKAKLKAEKIAKQKEIRALKEKAKALASSEGEPEPQDEDMLED